MSWLKKIFDAPPSAAASDFAHFVFVKIPEPIEPDERHERYENALDAELRLAGLGEVSGGGTALSAEDADGSRQVEYIGVDVDTNDVAAARTLLRHNLPELGCPAETEIQYRDGETDLADIFDGENWTLAVIRTASGQDF